ncbi:MAG: hypothetical protein J6T57_02565 [Alphaproteobacteria bacterium]|nr:hypothetical protein [Alphaproteobacteria bacterium]
MKYKVFMIGGIIGMIGAAYADPSPHEIITSQYYVDTAVADKQIALQPSSGNNVVLWPTSSQAAGQVGSRAIVTSVGSGGTGLPTAAAVNTAVSAKQDKLSGTSGTLVTYGTTAGQPGSQAIYDSTGTWTNNATQQAALVNAGHVNSAVSNGLRGHITCYQQTQPTDPNEEPICLLWEIDTSMAGVYVPNGDPVQGD